MYQRIDAPDLNALFLPMSGRRPAAGVYFVRVAADSPQVREMLWRYHQAAAAKGVIFEQSLGNPDQTQISYMTQTLGDAFECDEAFILKALSRWMPRMSEANRKLLAEAMLKNMEDLRSRGKTESMLKSIYTKLMCWLYYRFERLMPVLGEDDPPRILYCDGGTFTRDELVMLRLLSMMGNDILVLHSVDQQAYLKQDPRSEYSQLLQVQGTPFPKDFTLKQFRKEMSAREASAPMRTAGTVPQHTAPSSAARNPAAQMPQPGHGVNFTRPSQRPEMPASASAAQPAERKGGIIFTPPSQRQTAQPQASAPAAQPAQHSGINFTRPSQRVTEATETGNGLRGILKTRFPEPQRPNCINAWMKNPDYHEILT